MYQRFSCNERTSYPTSTEPAEKRANTEERDNTAVQKDSPFTARSQQGSRFSTLLSGKAPQVRRDVEPVSTVEIHLNQVNEDGIYRPGDAVRGNITLNEPTREGKSLRKVSVKLVGEVKL
jgi:hypothetical protein